MNAAKFSEIAKKVKDSQKADSTVKEHLNASTIRLFPTEHKRSKSKTKSKGKLDQKSQSLLFPINANSSQLSAQNENLPSKNQPLLKREKGNKGDYEEDKNTEYFWQDFLMHNWETPSKVIRRYGRNPTEVTDFIEKDLHTAVECWRCQKKAIPVVTGEPSSATHIAAAVLAMFCLIPCMYMPYWFDCMCTPVKRCSGCGAYITEPTR